MGDKILNFIPLTSEFRTIIRDKFCIRYAKIFTERQAKKIFQGLEKEVVYSKPENCRIQVYGKSYFIPRQQIGYALSNTSYDYSGKSVETTEWTPLMRELLDYVIRTTKQDYNFVLVNRYKDGTHKIGYHSDDEISIDSTVPIASLTLGAEREFVFRKKNDSKQTFKMTLQNGSLLLMDPPTNAYWQHSLPADKRCKAPRVNLTFRKIVSLSGVP